MLLALVPLLLANSLSAQPPKGTAELEQEIRKPDRAEAAAVLLTDLPAIEKKGKAPFAGQTVRRRFTNIWMKREGGGS